MRLFSRWMPPPPAPPPVTIFGWLFLAALLGGLIALVVAFVIDWPVLSSILVIGLLLHSLRQRVRRPAEQREGEDIGTFARAFDRSNEPFDPWVIRATWDALTPLHGMPLRPTDLLDGIDILELEDLLIEVAGRSGHSLEGVSGLDFETVGDFVRLITAQPQLSR